MLIWFNTDPSPSRWVECRPLPFPTLLSFRRFCAVKPQKAKPRLPALTTESSSADLSKNFCSKKKNDRDNGDNDLDDDDDYDDEHDCGN